MVFVLLKYHLAHLTPVIKCRCVAQSILLRESFYLDMTWDEYIDRNAIVMYTYAAVDITVRCAITFGLAYIVVSRNMFLYLIVVICAVLFLTYLHIHGIFQHS